jgi:uncharacterized protein YjiS (DUF1127 family)
MQNLPLQNLRVLSYLIVNGHSRPKQFRTQRKIKVNIVRAYNNWRRYRNTVAELGRLDTRELNDLGISRGDIPFIAMKSAAR